MKCLPFLLFPFFVLGQITPVSAPVDFGTNAVRTTHVPVLDSDLANKAYADLTAGISSTGWANYADDYYLNDGTSFTAAADTTYELPINAGTVNETQMPADITAMYSPAQLAYTNETVSFSEGETVTGTAGGSATITRIEDNGTTGILFLAATNGTDFVDGETIIEGAAPNRAGIAGEYRFQDTENLVFELDLSENGKNYTRTGNLAATAPVDGEQFFDGDGDYLTNTGYPLMLADEYLETIDDAVTILATFRPTGTLPPAQALFSTCGWWISIDAAGKASVNTTVGPTTWQTDASVFSSGVTTSLGVTWTAGTAPVFYTNGVLSTSSLIQGANENVAGDRSGFEQYIGTHSETITAGQEQDFLEGYLSEFRAFTTAFDEAGHAAWYTGVAGGGGTAVADGTYSPGQILGRDGDGVAAMITFDATPSALNTYVDVWIDIGSPVGEIYRQTVTFPKGTDQHGVSVGFAGFTLGTWATNGGTIYIRANKEVTIDFPRVVVTRTHKAR